MLGVSNKHFVDSEKCQDHIVQDWFRTNVISGDFIVAGSIRADRIVARSLTVEPIPIQDARAVELINPISAENIAQINSASLVGELVINTEPVVGIAPRITADHRLTGVRRFRDRSRVLFLVYMELDITQMGMATEMMPVSVVYDHHGNLNDQRLYYVPQSLGVGEVYRVTRATRDRLDGEFVEL